MRQEDDIQALRLGLRTLHLLNERESLSCSELAVALAVSRAAAHRVLHSLEGLGYVARDGSGRPRRHRLRPRVSNLSGGYVAERVLTDLARPLLVAFTAAHGWPVALGVAAEDDCYLCFTTDGATTRLLSRIRAGERQPYLRSAIGQVCLAGLPAAVRDERVRRLGLPPAEVDSCVQRVGSQRFAIDDRAGGREIDLAVPVWRESRIVAAINLRYMRVAANGAAGHAQRLALLASLSGRLSASIEGPGHARGRLQGPSLC
jgi:IclR family pca regulon transcriptional regulator